MRKTPNKMIKFCKIEALYFISWNGKYIINISDFNQKKNI